MSLSKLKERKKADIRRFKKSSKLKKFVIRLHDARRAGKHYDLALEKDDDLYISFVSRKGFPKRKSESRLLIPTYDHKKNEAFFEGKIKQGYGAGRVKIWDSGFYSVLDKKEDAMKVAFYGSKLNGIFLITKTKDDKGYYIIKLGSFD